MFGEWGNVRRNGKSTESTVYKQKPWKIVNDDCEEKFCSWLCLSHGSNGEVCSEGVIDGVGNRWMDFFVKLNSVPSATLKDRSMFKRIRQNKHNRFHKLTNQPPVNQKSTECAVSNQKMTREKTFSREINWNFLISRAASELANDKVFGWLLKHFWRFGTGRF